LNKIKDKVVFYYKFLCEATPVITNMMKKEPGINISEQQSEINVD